jgi:hypothetical protein
MMTFSGASNQGNVGMQALGNGWYRIWLTWNATTLGTIQALFQTDQGTFGTPTAGQGYYISRCMVAPGQISPYVDNATAAALTVAADDISATGALATALAASTGTLRIDTLSTTRRSNSNAIGSAVARTLLGANGVILMGATPATS